MMQSRIGVLAAALIMAPLAARTTDLVVWWEKGFYPQEDEAVAEIIAAFEQQTGKKVELVQPIQDEIFDQAQTALAAGRQPDFLHGLFGAPMIAQWAYEDRLADLEGVLGPLLDLFDADAIAASTFLNASAGRRGLYALPMGRNSNHVHVWRSLLEQAGFTLDDIPKSWNGFWSFWCDTKAGRHRAVADDFVRFLIEDGWLAHWLNFAGDRHLPPMRKLIEQPFWLDPSDPHRMRAAIQILTQPHQINTGVPDNEWRSTGVWQENVWGQAVHRVVTEGISPEQAVDDAIARIKEILGE